MKTYNTFKNIASSFFTNLFNNKFFILIPLIILLIYFYNIGFNFKIINYLLKLLISFAIFHYIFNKFKYSENILIRLIQKFILYSICFYLSIFVLDYFDLIGVAHCSSGEDNYTTDNKKSKKGVVETIVDGAVQIYKEMESSTSAMAAGGAAASALIKSIPNAPLGAKVVGASAVAAGVSGSVIVGTKVGEAMTENVNFKEQIQKIEEVIKKHPYADPEVDRIPTPDSNIIPSLLENGEQNIPLIVLLESLEILNVLEIMLIVALIILFFNNNIYNLNIKIISYILNKYIPDNYHNKINTFLNKGTEYNKKYINILIVLIITILLILKLGNLYITSELYSKVDDYVLVYNYLKKNIIYYLSCHLIINY